jgi:hypothetical protein
VALHPSIKGLHQYTTQVNISKFAAFTVQIFRRWDTKELRLHDPSYSIPRCK